VASGVDTAIEAVGIPATFDALRGDRRGGRHHRQRRRARRQGRPASGKRLWSHNISITTRLVDTVSMPMLLKTVQSKRIDAKQLITHRFKLSEILQAYDTFGRAADTKALKVIIEA
jgi:alcohol dehydrogenase